jgi:hypothetical protein
MPQSAILTAPGHTQATGGATNEACLGAWLQAEQALIRKERKAVAGHCYSATAIRGQLARDMFQDFVENLEGEILTLR